MDNIVSAKLDSRYASTLGVWQYDYGQVLRITGPELPPAVEVQFSLDEKSGETLSRVGTTVDGVTEVKIPDELLTHSATSNYRIYAYIYLTDETSGSTKYEITIPVRVRSKPTSPAEDPETDPDLFRETVVAVNASAERAKMAEQNAKESATEAGKYAASASKSAVTAEKIKEDALRKVGEKKQEAIEAIQNQEETSVGKITTHTDGEIQRIQNQATDSKGELEQTIINAGVSKEELDESIQTASDTKTALDKSVELAGTAKTELDTSIREAGTAKTALDESTETAGTVQETLSATVKQAGALDTSLGENIETGTQLKTGLVASGEKAVQDIQATGSEQLGKMQAVAEAFTADREQIANNKEDIGSLQEDLGDIESKFEIETEAFSNKCSIIRNNTPNNFTGNQITGVKQYFDFGENAALTKIKMNIKASNDDTVVLEIATLDGNIIATAEKAVTTEYTDVVFGLENIVIKEPVSVFVYTKGTNLLSYGLYATPYDDQSFSYIFPDGTRKSAFKIGTSEILKPTASNNKQCLVLFFDYTSKIIKNISDSISQNIDITLLKSGKAADAKVVGDKLSKLEEDLSNKITKFYASNQGENHLDDSDDGKIQDMMICGNSNQNQTKGKNLLKYPYIAADDMPQGIIFTDNKDGSISVSGTATGAAYYNFYKNIDGKRLTLASGTYKLVVKGRSKCNVVANNGVNSVKNEGTFTITDGHNEIYCYIAVREGVTVDETIYPMIQLASITDESYEPYTGGIPSPSPDYPQEIKRVVNPIMKVCGKNLWDNFKTLSLGNVEQKNGTYISTADTMQVDITSSSIGARPLLLKANNAYTFSLKTTVSISSPKFVCLRYTNGESNNIIFTNKNFVNFVPERDVEKIGFILYESVAGDKAYDVQLEMGSEATSYEPYTEQSVQLPYTFNAIPVASGGNVTIDGQQYIADRVVEKDGVFGIERNIREIHTNTKTMNNSEEYPGWNKVEGVSDTVYYNENPTGDSRKLTFISNFTQASFLQNNKGTNNILYYVKRIIGYSQSELIAKAIDVDMCVRLQDAIFEPLPGDIQAKLRTLVTNYPVTNISVTSDQLDGYTVFNYPISMKNGWDYVKKQLNDNRDYIYDMDAKAQDIDIQSAEAYVNSEYAVALAELEV